MRGEAIPVVLPCVAVVVPAYRCASRIADVIGGIPAYVRHIVVVDDASPDETSVVVEAVGDQRVSLMRHGVNQGVGGAIMTGWDEAQRMGAEIVVVMAGDGQMDPTHLLQLLVPVILEEADYAKGNRFLHPRELRSMPLSRRIGNAGLSFLTKLASGYWSVFDPTNGYTALRSSVIGLLDREALAKRFFFEISLLIELGRIRAVVRDVSIPARYRGEISSLKRREALIGFPPRLFGAFVRRVVGQYFVHDFTVASLYLVVGVVLLAFGTVWSIVHWIQSGATGIPATTGTVMVGVLPVVIGFQLLLHAMALDIQSAPVRPVSRSLPPIAEVNRPVG